jgi:hypothetical protein
VTTIARIPGGGYRAQSRWRLQQTFDVWFRVPRDRYIAEWARVIDEFNPIEPLA